RRAHVLAARALDALGRRAEAARRWTAALDAPGPPAPDLYVARSRSVLARGPEHAASALAGLDQGIAKLGQLPQLQLPAVEAELVRGDTDAALARLAALAAASKRKEAWHLRRAEILLAAGRRAEACTALHEAREALARLSAKRRSTAAMVELAARVDELLQRVEAR
ncbi:MAG: hypothetical protein AAF682_32550, partial [Planctomycetota bacterium]